MIGLELMDLQPGMVVETYDGTLLLVVDYYIEQSYAKRCFVNHNSWIASSHYNHDLTRVNSVTRYDGEYNKNIQRVYKVKQYEYDFESVFQIENLTLLWERPE